MSDQIIGKLNRDNDQKKTNTKKSQHYEFLIDLFTDHKYRDIVYSYFSSYICRSVLMSYSLNPNKSMLIEPLSLKYGTITGFVEMNKEDNNRYEMYINSYKYTPDNYIQDKDIHDYIQKDDVSIMKAVDRSNLDNRVNFIITDCNGGVLANLKSTSSINNYILVIDDIEVCAFMIEKPINNYDEQVNILIPNTLFYSEGKNNIIREYLNPTIDCNFKLLSKYLQPRSKLVHKYGSRHYYPTFYISGCSKIKLRPILTRDVNDIVILECTDCRKTHQQAVEFRQPITPLIAFSMTLIRFVYS